MKIPSVVAAVYDRHSFFNTVRLFATVIDRRYNGMLLLVFILALSACSSAVTPEKISQIKPAMKVDQVEAILGRPAHIDQSETTGLSGQVYYYTSPHGEARVTFLNDAVFKAEFIPGDKKS